MSARPRGVFVPSAAERESLDRACEQFITWRRDWHDGGIAADAGRLAAVRKAARAFHQAIGPLLHDPLNGTQARLLVRMQEAQSLQHDQGTYHMQLTEAYATALLVDAACGKDVARGPKKDRLAYVWIFHAADQWPAEPTSAGRFGAALLDFKAPIGVPAAGSIERIEDALTMWRSQHKGK